MLKFSLNTQTLITISLTFWLMGCANATTAEPGSKPEPEPSVLADRTIKETIALTGNTVYVYPYSEALNGLLDKKHQAEIVQLLQDYLKKKGFLISETFSKGYSTVYISGTKYNALPLNQETQKLLKDAGFREMADGSGVTQTTSVTKFVNGKVVTEKTVTNAINYNRLAIQWDINHYARRPKMWFALNFKSEKPLDTVWPQFKEAIIENLDSIKITPPSNPIKMAGDPGCLPRFGFEGSRVLDEDKELYKVTKVPQHSPAQKAGLRVGDMIEAIDSTPYASDWEYKGLIDVYEKKIAVPIKFIRNGEVLRSAIRAEVTCDGR